MISTVSKNRILELWKAREAGLSYPPADQAQITDFEDTCRKVPEDYRWFLLNCGGGIVGSEWVDSIDELHSTHTKFDEECTFKNGWKTGNCFIIGWDDSGSPISISPDGKILIEWEADGKIYQLAPSVEDWLLKGLVPSDG